MNQRICGRLEYYIKCNKVEFGIFAQHLRVYNCEYFSKLYMEKLEFYTLKLFNIPKEAELYHVELSVFLNSYLEIFCIENQTLNPPFLDITAAVHSSDFLYIYTGAGTALPPKGLLTFKYNTVKNFKNYIYSNKVKFKLII